MRATNATSPPASMVTSAATDACTLVVISVRTRSSSCRIRSAVSLPRSRSSSPMERVSCPIAISG